MMTESSGAKLPGSTVRPGATTRLSKLTVVATALLCACGMALAQTPTASPPQWHGHHERQGAAKWREKMEQRRMDRLAILLDLTPAERQQVQTIFSGEHAQMKTAMQQVQQAMKQARAAHQAARKEALQRLASVLSPTQMKKFKALMPERRMHGMMMHRMRMHGMGHDMDGGPPPMPPPGPGPQ